MQSKLVVLVVLAGAAQATPGGGYGKPKCRTVYETSYEKSCSTTYEKVCSSGGYGGYHKRDAEAGYGKREARRNYSAPRKSSSFCRQVPKQSCQNKPVQKPVKKCESVPKQSCSQVPKESCKSVPVKTPTKVAKQVCSGGGSSHGSGGYGGYRG